MTEGARGAGGKEEEGEGIERGGRRGWNAAGGECNDAPRMNMHDKRDRVSLRKRLKQFRAPELRSFVPARESSKGQWRLIKKRDIKRWKREERERERAR